MNGELKQHLLHGETWLRGFYMLLFLVIYNVAEIVILALVIFQFLFALFTGRHNDRLLKLGQNLSTFVYQIMLFLTFNSDYHPYPFGAWPKGAPKVSSKAIKTASSDTEETGKS